MKRECGETCGCPTVLTCEDVDKFVKEYMEGKYDIKKRPCFNCSTYFYPNYSSLECDECHFSRFSKEDRQAFYRSFFE